MLLRIFGCRQLYVMDVSQSYEMEGTKVIADVSWGHVGVCDLIALVRLLV